VLSIIARKGGGAWKKRGRRWKPDVGKSFVGAEQKVGLSLDICRPAVNRRSIAINPRRPG